MPVLISNGKHYRVPFISLLTGSIREERPTYGARSVSADCCQEVSRASSRRGPANLATRRIFKNTCEQLHIKQHLTGTIPWSFDDDRVLRELKASKVSWKRISMVMNNRPIAELKNRWIEIQDKHKPGQVYELYDDDGDWYFDEEYDREERHVSFSTSSGENEDTDDDEDTLSKRTKVKKVYYIDDEFTLDEVLLLHRIAADWKKDRWETISSRFNVKTGRSITPAQAKSVIDE